MTRKTGIIKDKRYLRHGDGFSDPETPQRLSSIYEMLDNPQQSWKFVEIEPRQATDEELALNHCPAYIRQLQATAGQKFVSLDPDTVATAESYEVARLAVGGLLRAIDAVMTGEVDNAFALVRPPGHHAGESGAAGFCLFNNVAVGGLYALQKYGLDRVLIVDWDLHHGNGTQQTFYEDDRVLYFSTHQYPAYPGTGALEEIGRGEGSGYTVNVPIRSGADDAQYVKMYRRILVPLARSFRPQLVLLSAGFDIYFRDPLGNMRVTPEGFAKLTRILLSIADECCGGKLVATLEGGYHVSGLTDSVKAVLQEMRGDTEVSEEDLQELEASADPVIDPLIRRVIDGIKPYWPVFGRA